MHEFAFQVRRLFFAMLLKLWTKMAKKDKINHVKNIENQKPIFFKLFVSQCFLSYDGHLKYT